MSVAILRQGDVLIASIRADLSDGQLLSLRDDLTDRAGAERIRGVILDVGALDVIDSFVARSLRSIVQSVRLRGTETVITGIRPDVAIAMVQFRLNLDSLRAVLDLDEAIALLDRIIDGEDADDG
jgi:rsbT antagonist protein RsbS